MKNFKNLLFIIIPIILYICFLDKSSFQSIPDINPNKKYGIITLDTFFNLIKNNPEYQNSEKKDLLQIFSRIKQVFEIFKQEPQKLNSSEYDSQRKQFHKFLKEGIIYEVGKSSDSDLDKLANLSN